MFELNQPIPLDEIQTPLTNKKKVRIFIKREDRIDTDISGNKWRKLKYNFLEAQALGYNTVLTFGGAFSNHIAATAAAAKKYGFQSIGIIRGDELNHNSNPTLQKAYADGMKLIFISRQQYKNRSESKWINALSQKHHAFIIPEGGSNKLAIKGMSEMVSEIKENFSHIICPVGTGGTLAGIASSINKEQLAIGIAALKGQSYLEDEVRMLLDDKYSDRWTISHDYHFGGYAKYDDSLLAFIKSFYQEKHIILDPVYTSKMIFGIYDLIQKDFFPKDSVIVAIHTGGLQGIEGFNNMHKLNLKY